MDENSLFLFLIKDVLSDNLRSVVRFRFVIIIIQLTQLEIRIKRSFILGSRCIFNLASNLIYTYKIPIKQVRTNQHTICRSHKFLFSQLTLGIEYENKSFPRCFHPSRYYIYLNLNTLIRTGVLPCLQTIHACITL